MQGAAGCRVVGVSFVVVFSDLRAGAGESRSFAMAGYLGSLNLFHSFRENTWRCGRNHSTPNSHSLSPPQVRFILFLLKAPQKCSPYGKTVSSEVHNRDPDTARATKKKTVKETVGRSVGKYGSELGLKGQFTPY